MSIGNVGIEQFHFYNQTLQHLASKPAEKINELFHESLEVLSEDGRNGSILKATSLLDSESYVLKISKLNKIASYFELFNELMKLKTLNQEQDRENKTYVPKLITCFSLRDHRLVIQLPLHQKDLFPETDEELLSLNQTFPFLKTLLEILCFLKRHGVVHLDIKPDNILLTGDGNYILGDFGHSVLEGVETVNFRGGTSVYLSPEVIVSPKLTSFPADMWALAATVCMVYGGVYLFGEPMDSRIGLFEKLARVSQCQQRRFGKPYPEELQETAREKGLQEQFLCDFSTFSLVRPFDVKMEQECRPKEEEQPSFRFLLSLLHKMFDFDRNTRITPENALNELSSMIDLQSGRGKYSVNPVEI